MTTLTANPTAITRNATDLAAAVRDAIVDHIPLVDYGIAHAGLGHAPPVVHTKLVQQADSKPGGGILEHYTRDLTVRAAAGITIGDLQRALKPTNQFVPIDADDDITLGEAIHHNTYGPLRVGYGSIRDLLLGLHYVDGEGRDIHVGGRTVKNVAGYDISRFMVGSLGELGIVHEATMRTYAIPEHVLAVNVEIADPSALDDRATDLLLSDAKPVQISYCHRADSPSGPWVARIAYFGPQQGCFVQLRALEAFLKAIPGLRIIESGGMSLEKDAAERAAIRSWRRGASALVKIMVPPAATGIVCGTLATFAEGKLGVHIDALPLHGCVFVGGSLGAEQAMELDAILGAALAPLGGLRVWHALPVGARNIDPFGAPQQDWPILMKLKRTMDPHGIFNPGRFLR